MKNLFLICIILVLSISCLKKRNKLNTNEQKLKAQIEVEELEKLEKSSTPNPIETNEQDTFSIGIRYQPERSIDPNNPPVVIDIAGNLDNIKEFKLLDIAQSIRYVRLESPGDSAFVGKLKNGSIMRSRAAHLKEELPFKIIGNKSFIVASNHLGMLLYNSNGKLLRIISKNEFSGFTLYKGGSAVRSGYTFIGANGIPRLIGNKLYYNYDDNVNNISKMMEVDCKEIPLTLPALKENKNEIAGLGTPIASTGKKSYSAVPIDNRTFAKVGQGDMFTLFNSNGDTLCSFPGTQEVENYTHSVARSPDWGNRFYYKSNLYFREGYSDTIFQVVPPNKLLPAFLLSLGDFKVENKQDAMTPGFDLSNKISPKNITVTNDYIFIYYVKGYDSPNARKANSVNYYHAIYNRRTNKLFHVKHNPLEYEFALENNLDGGLPVWPGQFSKKYFAPSTISQNGEILMSVKGNDLKEHIKTDAFKNSTAPAEKKEELVKLANAVRKYETIVVVMK